MNATARPVLLAAWAPRPFSGALLGLLACALPHASPALELPPGFIAETLATNLNAATAIAPAPDGRIFLAEQTGRLLVWKTGRLLEAPALTLHVTDYWERGLIGLTLDPDFPRVPQLFVLYVTDRPVVHHVLSRFTIRGDQVEPSSERILLEGDDQSRLGGTQPAGHQGGALRFGSDGKLYVGLGEQTAGEPSQSLETLQGKILRLNPDGSIPADNPFYSRVSGKYRAIVCLGVRNPFGLAAQKETGRIFFTDVGASAFEEVNELAPGANYGWPRAEGFSTNQAFRNPLYAYSPAVGQSICGGTFYSRSAGASAASLFPERWRGRFFFVDFMKHWIKAMDPMAPTNVTTFARGLHGPVAVEAAPDGSLLVLNRGAVWRDPKKFVANAGSLVRIRYAGATAAERATGASAPGLSRGVRPGAAAAKAALGLPSDFAGLPAKLSASRLFPALHSGVATPELLEFEVNLPEWTPGLRVRRFLALPPGRTLVFDATADWRLPPGTVLVHHFLLAATDGERPERAVETRLLVAGTDAGYGASYRWREDGAEAELVEDPELVAVAPGRHWLLAGPEEVLRLPSSNPAYAIDLNLRQLNRADAGGNGNQVTRWHLLGLLDRAPAERELETMARLVAPGDARVPAEHRVRSYLDVHCAVCHQPGGASRGLFDARWGTSLPETGLVNGPPAAGDLGLSGAKLVVPGQPNQSLLYRRLQATDFFRMPPVQAHNEPSPILPVMAEWIRSLPLVRADAGAIKTSR